jgi:SAM-dependent methyltransferase
MSLGRLRGLFPISLRHRFWQERMLRRAPGARAEDVERLFARIQATIDRERLRRLHEAHRYAPFDLKEAADHERKLRIAIVKAMVHGLHQTRPLRILDIGHGGGYFVTVARRLGHDAHGTEVPIERLPERAAKLYAEITAALGYHDERRLFVDRFLPLRLDAQYDLICAHKICFNDHMKPTTWQVPEWTYFVDDAKRHLSPGGKLVLELNENIGRYGALRWYDPDLLAYFTSVGRVDGPWITIPAQRGC